MKPRLLRPDNFTPPTRTPWGGHKIRGRYKAGLDLAAPDGVVGESWEVSVEPSFPSRFADMDQSLADAIAAAPTEWLGDAVAAQYGGQTPLLVKLLDSGDNLSVQVHPEDGDPTLADDESGKPESWYVLEAEPGAGLYLGFRPGVDRQAVEQCLTTDGPLNDLLNFVPVESGDFFVIAAGTAHAIGAGVTLVEPQYVAPGRRGITYRFWDWNRRYDAHGKADPNGTPREIHVERSLAVTDWDAPRGDAFVQTCRPETRALSSGDVARRALTTWRWFEVEEWSGTGTLQVPAPGTMWALTAVAGEAQLQTAAGEILLPCGQSAVVPAAAGDLTVQARDTRILATRCHL